MMPVEDVFTITGRGTVASGRIDRGTVKVGDEVEIVGLKEDVIKSTVTGVEMFHKTLDLGKPGTTLVSFYVGFLTTKSNVVKFWQNQAPSKRTSNSRVKSTL